MKIHSIKNLNTNEEVLKAGQSRQVEVIEVRKQSLIFEVSHLTQKFHANLLLSGVIHLKESKAPYQFICKIVSFEIFEDMSRIEVDLIQYDKELWVQFLQLKAEKQERADRIFRTIKGSE